MSSSQTISESSAMTELVTINLDRKLQSTIGPDHEEKVKLEVEFPLPKYPFLCLLPFCLREHFSAPPLHSLALDFSEHTPFPHPSSMEVLDSIPLSAIPLVWSRLPQSLSPKNGRECGSPAPRAADSPRGASHTTPHWQPVAATADIFRNKHCVYPEQVLTERTTEELTSRKLNPEGRTHM